MKTFHIRAPKPRKGMANEFYAEDGPRVSKTLCGEPVTEHDIRYGWEAYDGGEFVCCQACVARRKAARRGAIA